MRLLDAFLESRNMFQKAAATPSAAAFKERYIAMHIIAPSASHRASHCPTYLLRRSEGVLESSGLDGYFRGGRGAIVPKG